MPVDDKIGLVRHGLAHGGVANMHGLLARELVVGQAALLHMGQFLHVDNQGVS